MATKPIKTLTIDNTPYEIVDQTARDRIQELVGNQIPDDILQQIINDYANNNDGGMATKEELQQVNNILSFKVDGAYADDQGFLYLTSDGDVVVGPLGPFAGSTGGGRKYKPSINLCCKYYWMVV